MQRRVWISCVAATAAGLLGAGGRTLAADAFPSRPIRVVLPFAAGSGTDNIARALMSRVSAATKWTLVLDNKAGANGIIAAQEVKRAAPDGYTIFYSGNTTHGANSMLYKSLPYDPEADFEPITRIGVFPLVLLTRPNFGAADAAALVRAARERSGQVSFATSSAGPRVALENLQHESGTKFNHIPYKASPQALSDLMGGQIDAMFLDSVSSLPMIRAGSVKALAVTSRQRLSMLSEVPAMVEAGYSDFEVLNWSAIFVPHGTPQAIRDTFYKAFADVVASSDWKRYVAELGGYADTMTPKETAAWVRREIRAYRETLSRAGVRPE